MSTHRCGKCKEDLEASEFQKNRSMKNGLQSWCRPCQVAQISKVHSGRTPKVYVLTCIPTMEQYVGSTTRTLRKRYWAHRSAANAQKPSNLYYRMRTFDLAEHWKIEELARFPNCQSTDELRGYEQQAMDELLPALNQHNAIKESAHGY